MSKVRPIPSSFPLALTLAQRVFQLREFRNLTVRDLAGQSRFSMQRIEEIEAGMETWLSSTDRQLLAKALSVQPQLLLEVEVRPPSEDQKTRERQHEEIYQAILAGQRDLLCPYCQHQLKCSIQEALDINGEAMNLPKAFCLKCPFVLV